MLKNLPAMQETWFDSWVEKIHWRRDSLPTAVSLGFPWGSANKESECSAGDLGLISGLRRSPGEGKGYPLQRGHKESDTTERLSFSLSIIPQHNISQNQRQIWCRLCSFCFYLLFVYICLCSLHILALHCSLEKHRLDLKGYTQTLALNISILMGNVIFHMRLHNFLDKFEPLLQETLRALLGEFQFEDTAAFICCM